MIQILVIQERSRQNEPNFKLLSDFGGKEPPHYASLRLGKITGLQALETTSSLQYHLCKSLGLRCPLGQKLQGERETKSYNS